MIRKTDEMDGIRDVIPRFVCGSPELCAQHLAEGITDQEDGINSKFLILMG